MGCESNSDQLLDPQYRITKVQFGKKRTKKRLDCFILRVYNIVLKPIQVHFKIDKYVEIYQYLTFMCFLRLEGCVYDLSHPLTLQLYGLSEVWTWLCFLRSLEFAKRRSQPSNSHLKGFSPERRKIKLNKKYVVNCRDICSATFWHEGAGGARLGFIRCKKNFFKLNII